jgi:hypothetical protein
MPVDTGAAGGERLLLDGAEARARLDEMDLGGGGEARHDAHDPQEVGHQRAAAWAELGEHEASRRAHCLPDDDCPDADQLAEHLAHLRRRDEVAVAAERLTPHVIAVDRIGEAGFHILRDGHRTVGTDARDEFLAERAHGVAGASGKGGRRDAVTIR